MCPCDAVLDEGGDNSYPGVHQYPVPGTFEDTKKISQIQELPEEGRAQGALNVHQDGLLW